MSPVERGERQVGVSPRTAADAPALQSWQVEQVLSFCSVSPDCNSKSWGERCGDSLEQSV